MPSDRWQGTLLVAPPALQTDDDLPDQPNDDESRAYGTAYDTYHAFQRHDHSENQTNDNDDPGIDRLYIDDGFFVFDKMNATSKPGRRGNGITTARTVLFPV